MHAPIIAIRGNKKIDPGGKCLHTSWNPVPFRILGPEGDDSASSPVLLTPIENFGCRSPAPFAILTIFARKGAFRT